MIRPPSLIEPSLAPAWDEIIRRTLARDPAHRYQTAEEFLDAIAQLHEPADVADLPLPQLRTLGIGIALFAGLVLHGCFAGIQPTSTRLRQPSGHGAASTSRLQPLLPARRLCGPSCVRSPSRTHVADPAKAPPIHPALPRPRRHAPQSPLCLTGPPRSLSKCTPPESNLPARRHHDERSARCDVKTQPVASETEESLRWPPTKKQFWNKLNVFKKKRSEPKENPKRRPVATR